MQDAAAVPVTQSFTLEATRLVCGAAASLPKGEIVWAVLYGPVLVSGVAVGGAITVGV
ncbi:unannotated protein [freshwater metagenome]|uniref:Unannotated protein n=1 Tax=freshwater metagenome TaxID=449393 RepID=A0A6J7ECA0_9ZZZZ